MKKIVLFASIALLVACNTQKKDPKLEAENATETEVKAKKPVYGNKNFAVVWSWKTSDTELVAENSPKISEELTKLWKEGIVENAYYDSNAKVDKLEDFPNITFFLKAKSMDEATTILNNLTIVKKGIAEPTIYPVGTKWLGRKNENVSSQSFVAVWNTITEYDSTQAKKLINDNAQAQSNAILELWENGVVENVYFDIEGTVKNNLKTDFVFFINTETEKEAKAICDNLPFSKKQIAAYHLVPVGVFWMGEYQK